MSDIREHPDADLDEALLDLPEGERVAFVPLALRLRNRPLPSPRLRSTIRSRITVEHAAAGGSLRFAFGLISGGFALFAFVAIGLSGLGPLAP